MKILCNLTVILKQKGEPVTLTGGPVYIYDDEAFDQICELGFQVDTENNRIDLLNVNESDPRLITVIRILESLGQHQCKRAIVPRGLWSTHYTIQKRREHAPQDIVNADLLRINVSAGSGRMGDICQFCPPDVRHFYYKNGSPVVKMNARLKNKKDFGHLDMCNQFVCSERLRDTLDKAGFNGLFFEEVQYEDDTKVSKRLFHIRSQTVLPNALTPRQNGLGEDTGFNETQGICWDDGGYGLPELKYARADIESLPAWDIAMTNEVVGGYMCQRRELIVTQRFRQFMKENKVGGANYIPVHVV